MVLPSEGSGVAVADAPMPGDVHAEPGAPTNGQVVAPIQDPTPVGERAQFGQILIERRKITESDIAWAIERQDAARAAEEDHRRIGELLIERGVIQAADVVAVLAQQLGIGIADLRRESPNPAAVALLEESVARERKVVPFKRGEHSVTVVAADPAEPDLAVSLSGAIGERVELMVASEADVLRALDRAYTAVSGVAEHVKVFEAKAAQTKTTDASMGSEVDANAPVVQVVGMILAQAVRDRASDVHIEPNGERVRVRNRIDGALKEVLSLPQNMALALASRIKIMAGLNIVERRRPQDGQIEFSVDGRDLDIRVSTTSTVFGEKVVLRILDKTQAMYDVQQLGMPEETAQVYSELIRSPYGMVICAGPTGSGKTTTLYATLTEINNEEINVMTVEDPVEYVFPSINQIQINEQAGVTFAGGLRSILRQDPDAILVGEIRDVETARIAVQAALTGHFVLSTIHATDATSALHRFLDMGIESFLIASSMLAMVGQRLVRRSCPECLTEYHPTEEELAFYEKSGGKDKESWVHGAGCTFCSGTGYQGRVGVYEVLRITEEMKHLLVANAPHHEMKALAVSQGMIPLRDQAIRLVEQDTTTIAEVLRTIYIL